MMNNSCLECGERLGDGMWFCSDRCRDKNRMKVKK